MKNSSKFFMIKSKGELFNALVHRILDKEKKRKNKLKKKGRMFLR